MTDPRKGDRHKPRKGDRHKPRKGDRHKSRRARRVRVKPGTQFRAWDGEAIDGVYVLLKSSHGDSWFDPNGIGTEFAFRWLLERTQKHTIDCGFVSTYDVNMLIGEMDRESVVRLWTHGIVDWKGYRVRYRNRKEFSVSRNGKTFRLWDVFGFFQSSFVKAVESWLPVDTETLERMKANRPNFTWDEFETIETYCEQECALLQTLMERLHDAAGTANVKLSRWDGAGAIASALLKQHNVKAFACEIPHIEQIARCAFYGGRIETVRFGHHVGTVAAYDIRSAYPHALSLAPCFAHGSWHWVYGFVQADPGHALYRVEWDLTDRACPFGPFPWRDREGAIYFPLRGRGWYWGHEIQAAFAKFGQDPFLVLKSLVWVPDCAHFPFDWVPELYSLRETWKRQGNAAEKVLKLGLNSLYGKCAQRLGGHGLVKRPPTHNMLWASWTTSFVRARLLRIARDDSLIGFATDAVFANRDMAIFTRDGLGEWESAMHDTGTVVQSGVYWLGTGETELIEHTRGARPGEFTRAAVMRAWKRGQWSLETSAVRFMGIGAALVMRQGGWRTFRNVTRTLRLEPTGTKRSLAPGARLSGRGRIRPELGLIQTVPTDTSEQITRTGIDSTPIAVPWDAGGWNGFGWDVATRSDHEGVDGFE